MIKIKVEFVNNSLQQYNYVKSQVFVSCYNWEIPKIAYGICCILGKKRLTISVLYNINRIQT